MDDLPERITYFGQSLAIEGLRSSLTSSRGSTMINLIGAEGSGKSSLLEYILQEIMSGQWRFPQTGNNPSAVIISGKNFTKEDHFVEFIAKQALPRIKAITNLDKEEKESFIDFLNRLSEMDYPIIIMIDNFSRIMTEMHINDAQNLSSLRPAGVHYILVTDYRTLEEISPEKFKTSLFFKDTRPIYLRPLRQNDIDQFIQKKVKSLFQGQDDTPSETWKAWLAFLAGGHPGLLLAVANSMIYNDFNPTYFPEHCEQLNDEDKMFLRNLPQDEGVDYYLKRVIDSVVESYPNPREREILLKIAFGDVDGMNIPDGLQKQFAARGLVDASGYKCHSQLIRFAILNNISGLGLSAPESALFELLRKNRPRGVTFKDIWEAIKNKIQSEDSAQAEKDMAQGESEAKSPIEPIINSTIGRIRKKQDDPKNWAACINRAAFTILNERGSGFYMQSAVTFDQFLHSGPSLFNGSGKVKEEIKSTDS